MDNLNVSRSDRYEGFLAFTDADHANADSVRARWQQVQDDLAANPEQATRAGQAVRPIELPPAESVGAAEATGGAADLRYQNGLGSKP
jgi:hypothetical protein